MRRTADRRPIPDAIADDGSEAHAGVREAVPADGVTGGGTDGPAAGRKRVDGTSPTVYGRWHRHATGRS